MLRGLDLEPVSLGFSRWELISTKPMFLVPTPLHTAIQPHLIRRVYADECFYIVQLLVDAGANVEISDDEGRTPLHLAAQMANEASIRVLLDRGANIKAEDRSGLLPLDHAAASNSLEVFSLLYKRWADVMAQSSESAVEAWLQLAFKKARGASLMELQDWRSLSSEDLIDLTSDDEVKKIWAKMSSRRFRSWFRERQVRRES